MQKNSPSVSNPSSLSYQIGTLSTKSLGRTLLLHKLPLNQSRHGEGNATSPQHRKGVGPNAGFLGFALQRFQATKGEFPPRGLSSCRLLLERKVIRTILFLSSISVRSQSLLYICMHLKLTYNLLFTFFHGLISQ